MQPALQTMRELLHAISEKWGKRTDFSDFVWLARFRILFIYSLIKFGLVVDAGLIGTKLHILLPTSTRESILLLWGGITLGILASALLLILGLGLANKFRLSRSIGIMIFVATDLCLLLAVMNASMFENKLPLLVLLALVSCTTPLLVERISRYARRFTFSTFELAEAQRERDMLLLKHTQDLARAIEQERLSLKRELHDGLLQELSTLLLQVSMIMMRNSADGRLQLNTDEAEKMKTALDRAVKEARNAIQDLNKPSSLIQKTR